MPSLLLSRLAQGSLPYRGFEAGRTGAAVRSYFEGVAPALPPTPPVVGPGFGAGLAQGLARAQRRYSAASLRVRDSTWQEFLIYLGREPGFSNGDPLYATPEDVVAFMETSYLPSHGRTRTPSGEVLPAFSTVKGALSGLRKAFSILGRTGPWSAQTGLGNPCESDLVSDWRKAYQGDLLDNDIEPVAAAVMTELEFHQLIDGLDSAISELMPTGDIPYDPFMKMRAYLLQRDALYFTYLWMSFQRGVEAGRLRLSDLTLAGSGSYIRARRTKALKFAPPARVPLVPAPAGQSRYCFLARFPLFQSFCSRAGWPLTNYVFLVEGRDRKSPGATPLTSNAGNARLKKALALAGVNPSLTLHSHRRSRLVQGLQEGCPPSNLMGQALIRTPGVFARYVDQSRPSRAVHG